MQRRNALLGSMGLLTVLGSAGLTTSGCAQTTPATASGKEPKTLVLVHGALLGGWVWIRVADQLAAQGHRAFTPTLTGLGERRHLLNRDVNLSTHIEDVVNVIEWNDLRNVTLVGHSFAGIVTTAVADRLGPARVRELVFVDALVPLNGMAWRDFHAPANRESFFKNVNEQGEGWKFMPAPGVTHLGVTDASDTRWLLARQTAQPAATYTEPVRLTKGGYEPFPRIYIDCTQPVLPTINSTKERIRTEQGWKIVTMATGHLPMVTQPGELTRTLLSS